MPPKYRKSKNMESIYEIEQNNITDNILSQYSNIIKDEFRIDIKTKGRVRPKPDLLKIFCYHAHYNLKFSYSRIGKFVNRDHATIIFACKEYHKLRTSNPFVNLDFDENESDENITKNTRGKDFVKLSNFLLDRFFTIDGYERPEPNKEDLTLLVNCASEHTRGLWLKLIQNEVFVKSSNVEAEIVEHE
jgi:hypothetical protein